MKQKSFEPCLMYFYLFQFIEFDFWLVELLFRFIELNFRLVDIDLVHERDFWLIKLDFQFIELDSQLVGHDLRIVESIFPFIKLDT
ncbi:hypothetical protein [Metabacillus sediminilitoris]|uniref:Uncharacterized protein n=1 Tax=Metabacillus sediminilitoris TaxID=2567941 RepID=A0A4S4C0A9_9BACI|nr:hypothetical protein [Metabacillus sediminilitoris]QGQ44740.1 hypothetical protein GMB29_05320 [Metabacillus sediminilitoris]THF78912.1 hypothetical protein E6W99_14400 [Metabacillus sediminilitoris]